MEFNIVKHFVIDGFPVCLHCNYEYYIIINLKINSINNLKNQKNEYIRN